MSALKALSKGFEILLKNPKYLLIGGHNNPFWIFNRALVELEFTRKKRTEKEFVSFLLKPGVDEVSWEESQRTPMPLLTAITLLMKPKIIVETGVAEGSSSLSFLYALERNNYGELYSIEKGEPMVTEYGKKYRRTREEIGCIVPQELRKCWHLIFGDSKEKLPRLLRHLGEIDFFFHDSLHTEEHMMFEYKTAWAFLKKGGCLLSHDIGVSFKKFSQEVGRAYVCMGDMPKIGGIRK